MTFPGSATQPEAPLARWAILINGQLVGETFARDAATAAGQYRWTHRIGGNVWIEVKPWPGTDPLPPAA